RRAAERRSPWTGRPSRARGAAPAAQAPPAAVAERVRGHRGVETGLHRARDATSGEDRSQARTGNGPTTTAAPRDIAITVPEIPGRDNTAAATRHRQRDHHRIGNPLLANQTRPCQGLA
ncbi:MAG: hypothetical protein LBC97_01240, partial [Bifidobacteriaceae bacterium]|nr:hypothetical protein [Bifidobacteriaceae bacterium]